MGAGSNPGRRSPGEIGDIVCAFDLSTSYGHEQNDSGMPDAAESIGPSILRIFPAHIAVDGTYVVVDFPSYTRADTGLLASRKSALYLVLDKTGECTAAERILHTACSFGKFPPCMLMLLTASRRATTHTSTIRRMASAHALTPVVGVASVSPCANTRVSRTNGVCVWSIR